MTAIFISHASADGEHAASMQAWLNEQSLDNVFLDLDKAGGLRAGENWERRLYEEVARCHAVLLVVTSAWLASKWCFAEFSMARSLGKVIFPVLLSADDIDKIGPELGSIQAEHWTEQGRVHLAERLHAVAHEIARGHKYSADRPPYPGFLSFEREDAAIFFGRDPEIREISERLEARRVQGGASLLLVLGPSGSGKSSVVKAGVLPWLGREPGRWVVVPSFRPGGEPLTRLAKALAEKTPADDAWQNLRRGLAETPHETLRQLVDALRVGHSREATILLTIDQFEEAFAMPDAGEQAAFLKLLELIGNQSMPFMVLATIRSDLMGEVLKQKEFSVPHEVFTLGQMPVDRLPQVIEGPARVAAIQIERGLTQRIIQDAISADALPLLAFTLRELNDRFGEDDRLSTLSYEALGDPAARLSPLENSIRRKAEETIASAAPTAAELVALKDAFVNGLVRVNDQGVRLRRLAQMQELPEPARPLIHKLVQARLLSARGDSGEQVVEVAHEALLRAWPQLANWLDEEQDFLTGRRQIEEARRIWAATPADKKDSALLTGILLEKAREWSQENRWRLDEIRNFVNDSIDREDELKSRARRRLLGLLSATVTAAVFFALLGVLAALQWNRAQQAAELAAQEAERAQANELAAAAASRRADERFSLALGAVATGQADDDPRLALFLAGEAIARTAEPSGFFSRSALIDARQQLAAGDPHLLGSPVPVGDALSLALSPEGRLLVVGDRNGNLKLIDTTRATNGVEQVEAHSKGIEDLAFGAGGRLLASAGGDGEVRLWRVEDGRIATGEVLARFEDIAWRIGFDASGTQLAAGSHTGETWVWDMGSGIPILVSRLQAESYVLGVGLSQDAKTVLVGTGVGNIQGWSVGTGEPAFDPIRGAHVADIWQLLFSPAGDSFATASGDGSSAVFGFPDARFEGLAFDREQKIGAIAFSPTHPVLIGGGADGRLHLADLDKPGAPKRSAAGHAGRIIDIGISEDGKLLASLGRDQNVRLWSIFDPVPVSTDYRLDTAAKGVAISADGEVVAGADKSGDIAVWQGDGGAPIRLQGHAGEVWALDLSPDRTMLASADRAGEVRVWDIASATTIASWRVGDGAVWWVGFAPDGARLYAAGDDGVARMDLQNPQTAPVLPFDLGRLTGAAISPDGQVLATSGVNGKVEVFSLADERPLRTLDVVNDIVWHASFSPDGQTLAVSAADEVVSLWNLGTGERIWELGGHSGGATQAAFLSDGATLASTDRRGQLHLSDLATGRRLASPLRAHRGASWRVAAGARNNAFVTTGDDGVVRVWDILSEGRACEIGAPGFDAQRQVEYFGDGAPSLSCMEAVQR